MGKKERKKLPKGCQNVSKNGSFEQGNLLIINGGLGGVGILPPLLLYTKRADKQHVLMFSLTCNCQIVANENNGI